jgi:hypothetical protein
MGNRERAVEDLHERVYGLVVTISQPHKIGAAFAPEIPIRAVVNLELRCQHTKHS